MIDDECTGFASMILRLAEPNLLGLHRIYFDRKYALVDFAATENCGPRAGI
jgi:hypothetical protein